MNKYDYIIRRETENDYRETENLTLDRLFPPKEAGWQPSQEEFYIHSHSAITW